MELTDCRQVRARIGVHSGQAVVDVVNVAERLKELARGVGGTSAPRSWLATTPHVPPDAGFALLALGRRVLRAIRGLRLHDLT